MDRESDDDDRVYRRRCLRSESVVFDLESQRLDSDHYDAFDTTDSSISSCGLDESFQQIKDDLLLLHCSSPRKPGFAARPAAATTAQQQQRGDGGEPSAVDDDDDLPPDMDIDERFDVMKNRVRSYRAKETETLRQYIIELNNTLTRITNDKGMVKKCERLEQDIARQDKIQLLKADIAAIRSRLLSFARSDRLDSNLQNKSELQAFILSAKTELLNLETYWNGRNVVNITEEINRHFNELNDTVSNHVKKELTDLYSIYANARQSLECEISRYQSALNTWVECDKQLMEVEMKFKGFGDDDGTGRNQRVGWFGSVSDSGLSDSGSEHELNEQEKRLDNLKQMAKNLTSVLTPESDAILSILSRIESNEKQLKELQQTCKDLIGRTEIYTDENKMDGNESSVETNVVDSTATEETKSPFTKIKSNSALLWRTLRIAVPFYVFVMVLCSLGWLEPQCCDFQNNYKWSLALGLRYLNGPPPT